MRLAVLSDIHGNAEALRAVLEELDRQKVDQTVCLGDVVGYGPAPAECIRLVRERDLPCVMGNHDEYVTEVGAEDTWNIRDAAKESVLWTQRVLDPDDMAWLARLPMMLTVGPCQFTHASMLYWPRWRYVLNAEKAAPSFLFQGASVAFNGHTHLPILAAHRSGSEPRLTRLKSGRVQAGKSKFLVGVGSVGQPRDRDPRCSFVIYDTETNELQHLRVTYDIEATQRAVREAGLPDSLATRLAEGR